MKEIGRTGQRAMRAALTEETLTNLGVILRGMRRYRTNESTNDPRRQSKALAPWEARTVGYSMAVHLTLGLAAANPSGRSYYHDMCVGI
jgi:hypothetical protein